MKELYEKTNIDLHIYGSNINSTNYVDPLDISHKSYPDMVLLDAISMSCCYPFVFKPILLEDKCCIDGGLIINLPVNNCLELNKNKEEILVFKYVGKASSNHITDKTSVLDYIILLFERVATKLIRITESLQEDMPYSINCISHSNKNVGSTKYWLEALSSQKERTELIEDGTILGEEFYKDFTEKKRENLISKILNKFDNKLDKDEMKLKKPLLRSLSF